MATHHEQRRHYFIDKEIQLTYLITLLTPVITLSTIFIVLLFVVARDTAENTRLSYANSVDMVIVETLRSQDHVSSQSYQKALEAVQEELQMPEQEYISRSTLYALLWVVIPALILGAFLLGMASVHFSHKFAGPVRHLQNSCNQIAQGDYRTVIILREGDRLMDLAASFNEMVSVTRMRLSRMLAAKSDEERKEIAEELKI